ncbi:hypothetical protein A4X06_0g1662 [Tilletia controversa]|uniref:Uncharacterized protein n=1 Tax=Tilletia controversa TaxID=13291 RepID=A0A8X7MZD5_9BASI|nr:hypothetical protein A4X06_0g1662 [Tilletia controversa]
METITLTMPQLLQLLQLAARNGAQQTTPHTPAQPPRSDGNTSSQVHTAQNTAPEHHRIRTARLSNQNQQPSPHCADYRTRTPPIRTARLSNQHQQPSPHCAEHRIRTPPHPNSASLYSTPAAAGVPGVPQHVDLVCSSAYVELQSSIDSTTSARCSASASPAPTPAFSSSALSTTSSTPFAWSWCAAKRFKPVFTVLGIAILMSLISSIMNSHAPRGLPMGISVDSTVKRAIGSSRQLARSRSRSASPTQSYEAVIVPSPDDSDFLDSEIDLPKSGQDGMDEKEDQMDDRAALPSVDTLASNSNGEY